MAKRAIYAKSGVPELWLIDPEDRSLEIHALQEPGQPVIRFAGDERPHSPTLGGFHFTVEELFALE